jgi:cytochrome P450
MKRLPDSLPRATDIERLRENPLAFLAGAREHLGDLVVLREAGPIFSRAPECAGAVAVFGPANLRAVLTNIDVYGMPVSAARHLSLPPHLENLNFGLHSMRGEQRAVHQRLLAQILNERTLEELHGSISKGLHAFAARLHVGGKLELLTQMRELALEVSSRLMFGAEYPHRVDLASLLQAYFHARREAASPFPAPTRLAPADLIDLGSMADSALRHHIPWSRERSADGSSGILQRLAHANVANGDLSEDAIAGHGNVLFMSGNEPVAVSLTWIFLLLSQLPKLRDALRDELSGVCLAENVPRIEEIARAPLLERVVRESLRVLPPNSLMVRATTTPAQLGDVLLPAGSELVICPFVAHRDDATFPRPHEFLPSRWLTAKPSPFAYLPFGAGGHYCAGHHVALYTIKAALAFLLARCDLVLEDDQRVDWRINIMLMPASDPSMTIRAVQRNASTSAGKLLGSVGELVDLRDCSA